MKVFGAEGLLEPGEDVLTSGGRGDLEAAQAGYPEVQGRMTLEVWTNTGNR